VSGIGINERRGARSGRSRSENGAVSGLNLLLMAVQGSSLSLFSLHALRGSFQFNSVIIIIIIVIAPTISNAP